MTKQGVAAEQSSQRQVSKEENHNITSEITHLQSRRERLAVFVCVRDLGRLDTGDVLFLSDTINIYSQVYGHRTKKQLRNKDFTFEKHASGPSMK